MFSKLFVAVLPLLLIFPGSVFSGVSINEFSSNSDPEWIELYNDSTISADLNNWYLIDAANHKEVFSTTIAGNGYFLYQKAAGWLNNSNDGDTIYLYDDATPSATLIDSVTYGTGKMVDVPDATKSSGRVPDGTANWFSNLAWSQQAANTAPSPTSVPNTPTPTNIPAATPTNTPAPTARPTSTPTLRVTTTPRPTITVEPSIGDEEPVSATTNAVGQLLDFGSTPPSTITPAILGETTAKKSKSWLPFVIIGVGGVGLIASLVLLFFHSRRDAILSE